MFTIWLKRKWEGFFIVHSFNKLSVCSSHDQAIIIARVLMSVIVDLSTKTISFYGGHFDNKNILSGRICGKKLGMDDTHVTRKIDAKNKA